MESRPSAAITSIIWLLVTLFYCYQYILRLLPNIIMPELMKQFSVGASEFGDFAGVYYIGYILMQIPIGLMLSRFGGKYIMPISILITTLGILPIISGHNWALVLVGRFFIGVGASAAIVGAFQIFRVIFAKHFTRALGAFVCVGLSTAVYATKPLGNIIHNIGINSMLNTLFIAGIALSAATYIILPKMPTSKSDNIWKDIKAVIGNKKIIFISLLAGLMVGPLEGFADAWGSAFLKSIYEIERNLADAIVAKIFLGMCVGSLILPYIAEKTKSNYGLTLISGIIMGICFIFMLSANISTSWLYLICLLIGICSAYQVVIISFISTFAKEELSGMAAAVSNMIVMSFGSFFHASIAKIIERTSVPIIISGIPQYSKDSYIYGISLIPCAIIVAVIGFIIAIITHKKQENLN